MANETPNPTPAEVMEILPLMGGRISIAQLEIVRRLRATLPGAIAMANEQMGLTGNLAIPAPKWMDIAPLEAHDKAINSILVSVALSTVAHAPGMFRKEATVIVYSLDARIQGDVQLSRAYDRAMLVEACLYPFLNGCIDDRGRNCWRQLEPTGQSMLPAAFDEFSGVAIYYRMVLDPTENNWY